VGGKRHPTIGDNVIIGSGAQVIGPITVGARARIGANAVVTEDVPEGATMVGLKARSTLVPVETYMRDFVPYGTPCNEPCEPDLGRVEALEQQLTAMRAEIAALREATTSDRAAASVQPLSGTDN
jgi:serine O-acetyltransferase